MEPQEGRHPASASARIGAERGVRADHRCDANGKATATGSHNRLPISLWRRLTNGIMRMSAYVAIHLSRSNHPTSASPWQSVPRRPAGRLIYFRESRRTPSFARHPKPSMAGIERGRPLRGRPPSFFPFGGEIREKQSSPTKTPMGTYEPGALSISAVETRQWVNP